jgi:endonuclease/exonuclease/phosphatase family metal-dependent hydrolase
MLAPSPSLPRGRALVPGFPMCTRGFTVFVHMPALLLAVWACDAPETAPATTAPSTTAPATTPVSVRFATFNVSMFRDAQGRLAEDLADPDQPQAKAAAAILQEVRPDVVLLNELDHDPDGLAVQRFHDGFLAVGQDGREPLDYPYRWAPPVNTGVPSGFDLDNDGAVESEPGSEAYGNDSFGFGTFPGQYGLAVLSVHPIDEEAIRTFQRFLWRDLPDAALPEGWYSPEELDGFRLSSKTHADVPVEIGGATVHLLVSHPTPPSFDGPEDRNGRRNRDEIRFWLEYLDGGATSWHVDDEGQAGALTDEPFVMAGDLNNDPHDGSGDGSVVADLLAHPRVGAEPTPRSDGGVEQAERQGGRNRDHRGDPAHDTADFEDNGVGNLRVDYVLPSSDLEVSAAGVFWPASDDPAFPLVGTFPYPVSDHRLVWVDLAVPAR